LMVHLDRFGVEVVIGHILMVNSALTQKLLEFG
jgi:hypothetical protein